MTSNSATTTTTTTTSSPTTMTTGIEVVQSFPSSGVNSSATNNTSHIGTNNINEATDGKTNNNNKNESTTTTTFTGTSTSNSRIGTTNIGRSSSSTGGGLSSSMWTASTAAPPPPPSSTTATTAPTSTTTTTTTTTILRVKRPRDAPPLEYFRLPVVAQQELLDSNKNGNKRSRSFQQQQQNAKEDSMLSNLMKSSHPFGVSSVAGGGGGVGVNTSNNNNLQDHGVGGGGGGGGEDTSNAPSHVLFTRMVDPSAVGSYSIAGSSSIGPPQPPPSSTRSSSSLPDRRGNFTATGNTISNKTDGIPAVGNNPNGVSSTFVAPPPSTSTSQKSKRVRLVECLYQPATDNNDNNEEGLMMNSDGVSHSNQHQHGPTKRRRVALHVVESRECTYQDLIESTLRATSTEYNSNHQFSAGRSSIMKKNNKTSSSRKQQKQRHNVDRTTSSKQKIEKKKTMNRRSEEFLVSSMGGGGGGGNDSQGSKSSTIILDPLTRMIDTALSNYYETGSIQPYLSILQTSEYLERTFPNNVYDRCCAVLQHCCISGADHGNLLHAVALWDDTRGLSSLIETMCSPEMLGADRSLAVKLLFPLLHQVNTDGYTPVKVAEMAGHVKVQLQLNQLLEEGFYDDNHATSGAAGAAALRMIGARGEDKSDRREFLERGGGDHCDDGPGSGSVGSSSELLRKGTSFDSTTNFPDNNTTVGDLSSSVGGVGGLDGELNEEDDEEEEDDYVYDVYCIASEGGGGMSSVSASSTMCDTTLSKTTNMTGNNNQQQHYGKKMRSSSSSQQANKNLYSHHHPPVPFVGGGRFRKRSDSVPRSIETTTSNMSTTNLSTATVMHAAAAASSSQQQQQQTPAVSLLPPPPPRVPSNTMTAPNKRNGATTTTPTIRSRKEKTTQKLRQQQQQDKEDRQDTSGAAVKNVGDDDGVVVAGDAVAVGATSSGDDDLDDDNIDDNEQVIAAMGMMDAADDDAINADLLEDDEVSVEIHGGLGYWNERGELVLEAASDPLVSGTTTANNWNHHVLARGVSSNRRHRNIMIMDGELDHDSNDEMYEGNDYPDEEDGDDDDYRSDVTDAGEEHYTDGAPYEDDDEFDYLYGGGGGNSSRRMPMIPGSLLQIDHLNGIGGLSGGGGGQRFSSGGNSVSTYKSTISGLTTHAQYGGDMSELYELQDDDDDDDDANINMMYSNNNPTGSGDNHDEYSGPFVGYTTNTGTGATSTTASQQQQQRRLISGTTTTRNLPDYQEGDYGGSYDDAAIASGMNYFAYDPDLDD